MIPASFATIATKSCAHELAGLLLSLSLFHEKSNIHILCDDSTKQYIDNLTPKPKLKINWYLELNDYTHLNRANMEKMGIFSKFLKSKAKVMLYALTKHKDVLFLDSDIIVTNPIEDVNKNVVLGVSPQFLVKQSLDETGYFNAGMLWTKSAQVCEDWIKFTDTSRYFEQAAIENLVQKYSNFKFGEEYNVQCWRYIFNHEPFPLSMNFKSESTTKQILYKNKPLRCIHTHLRDGRFSKFNNLVISHLKNANLYSLLVILFRVYHGNWVIRIPKHQFQDSFRELAVVWGENTSDLKIEKTNDNYCWLAPDILLYDRPTLEWITPEVKKTSLFLLANGNSDGEEGKLIQEKVNVKVSPWIFWPRRPKVLEYYLQNNRRLFYHERPVSCIFIGNIENEVQSKFRKPLLNELKDVVQVFECTFGKKHKYSALQYLEKLQFSKYGLCIRGYGVKCHREIELMSLGTVPIVTKEVNTNSYMEPLEEDKHFFRITSAPELKYIIDRTPEEKWRKMSNACMEWYQRNVNSKNAWETLITRILFYPKA